MADDIADHRPLLEGALVVAGAVVARGNKDGSKGAGDDDASNDGHVLKRNFNDALFGNEPVREPGIVLLRGLGSAGAPA